MVQIEDFETESGFDFLQFFNGNTEDALSLGAFSGTEEIPQIVTTSNQLLIKFQTDNCIRKKGFKLNYSTVEEELINS